MGKNVNSASSFAKDPATSSQTNSILIANLLLIEGLPCLTYVLVTV